MATQDADDSEEYRKGYRYSTVFGREKKNKKARRGMESNI